jgi:O-antigen ligase
MNKAMEKNQTGWDQISLLLGALGLVVSSLFLRMGTDPFNLPKMMILTIGACTILFLVLNNFLITRQRVDKRVTIAAAVFLIALLNSFLFSGAPLTQQFFGAYGRNTGLLTHIMLLILFVASTQLYRKEHFNQVRKMLFLAGVFNLVICAFELLKLNPQGVTDSYAYGLIGTFGNPNFLASFIAIAMMAPLSALFEKNASVLYRVICSSVVIVTLFMILKSQAKQGIIVSIAGFTVILFFYVSKKFKSVTLNSIYLAITAIGSIVGILGMLQKGPLTSFLYKPSVSYRGEYWAAGINMFKTHVLHGVGLNSYGDWYRASRRVSALEAPGARVTTNTAHNVFIDYAASGGIILLFAYVAIVGLALLSAWRVFRRMNEFDITFVSLFTAWICYLIQSVISIDQIGISVWGWILPGILIAMDKSNYLIETNPNEAKNTKKNPKFTNLNGATRATNRSPLFIVLGAAIGLLISFPAQRADISWKNAQDTTNADTLISSGKMWPMNEYKLSRVIVALYSSKLNNQALELINTGTKEFPRSSGMWQFLYYIPNSTPAEKNYAREKIILLDPNNPESQNLPIVNK